jgi:hypothetical protein
MRNLIKNDWHVHPSQNFHVSGILNHDIHPEGLDVDRIRFFRQGNFIPDVDHGHIISLFRGKGKLLCGGVGKISLALEEGVHTYLPPGLECRIDAEAGSEFLRVSCASPSQARGKKLLIRDEKFVAACAAGSQSLRWILTPQYLSRRIFLHHDATLLSKSGNPVSWFRTTMFDVSGLPKNEEGESVFKMSYNSRTEFNVCYDVKGEARVRMAYHPYKDRNQLWGAWLILDADSTYHLNEAAGGPEEESRLEKSKNSMHYLRNKHEVFIADGYVTLFCLFDPAPTGVEHHLPGEYSDYEPLSRLIETSEYEIFQGEITKYDEMINELSLAKAKGSLDDLHGTAIWQLYLQGREAQLSIEAKLAKQLASEAKGRDRIIADWMGH